jgi:hypothetical protein
MTLHVCPRVASGLLFAAVVLRLTVPIYEVERVEVGVSLAPDIFTLRASIASGGGPSR